MNSSKSSSKNRSGMKAYQQMAAMVQEHEMDREQLFMRYQKRIYQIAHRLKSKIPAGSPIEFEDLVSYGAIGLFDAADRFDPQRDNQFSTFVDYRIRGAMLDALRSLDEMSRHSRDQAKDIQYHTKNLALQLNREPTPTEISQSMGIPIEQFYSIQNKVQSISHVSIDVQDSDENTRSLLEVLADDSSVGAEDILLNEEFRRQVRQAIEQLSEQRRNCILLYYARNLNLSEIAEVFDVTPSRISQILSSARKELRESLKDIVREYDFHFDEE